MELFMPHLLDIDPAVIAAYFAIPAIKILKRKRHEKPEMLSYIILLW